MSLLLLLRGKGGGEGPPPWAFGDQVVLVGITLTTANLMGASATVATASGSTLTDGDAEGVQA